MSFINKSVNYSQTSLLKKNILAPMLELYNSHLLKQNGINNTFSLSKNINSDMQYEHLIPNNNVKYYLCITKKTFLETNKTNKENYNILYFFPDDNKTNDKCNDKNINIITHTISDFYLEINNTFNDDLLFEGYLYKSNDKYEYLITDILVKNNTIISCEYELRFSLLSELIFNCKHSLKDLNNHLTINVHPIFNKSNENMIKIFRKNFIYKNDIVSIERIQNFKKQRFIEIKKSNDLKIVEFTKQTDVYNVYNNESNDYEGILYIKGIEDSQKIKKLFLSTTKINIQCKYNDIFSKWQPIFEN